MNHERAVAPGVDQMNPNGEAFAAGESLVTDSRSGLTPVELVERKLIALLQSPQLPMSGLYAYQRPFATAIGADSDDGLRS